MQRQHTGRPGTVVVPADWAVAPAAIVARALASTVQIGPLTGEPQWDPGLRRTVSGGLDPVYDGPASVMAVSDSARALTVVEDPVAARVYDITLALARTGADLVQAEHVVLVTACDDAALQGKRLHVHQVEKGTRRFSRVLLASLLD